MVWTKVKARTNLISSIHYALDGRAHDNKAGVTDRVAMASFKNCSRRNWERQFKSTLNAGNVTKNEGYQIIESFDPKSELLFDRPDDIKKANKLGVELAKELFPDRQFVVVTQIDSINNVLHNHIICNSVDFKQHKSYKGLGRYGRHVMKVSDRQCQQAGLNVPQQLVNNDGKSQVRNSLKDRHANENRLKKGQKRLLKYVLFERINQVLNDPAVLNFDDFKDSLSKLDVEVKRSNRGKKGLSYRIVNDDFYGQPKRDSNGNPILKKNGKPSLENDKMRASRLGTNYTLDGLESVFNQHIQAYDPNQEYLDSIDSKIANASKMSSKSDSATSAKSSSIYDDIMESTNDYIRKYERLKHKSNESSSATTATSSANSSNGSLATSRVQRLQRMQAIQRVSKRQGNQNKKKESYYKYDLNDDRQKSLLKSVIKNTVQWVYRNVYIIIQDRFWKYSARNKQSRHTIQQHDNEFDL